MGPIRWLGSPHDRAGRVAGNAWAGWGFLSRWDGRSVPTLNVLQGPNKGQRFETPVEAVILGRTSGQIQLNDHAISRRHAEIRPVNGHWILEDLGSSNGTFVNGQRIHEPTRLNHGDQIKIGGSLLVFSGEDAGEGFNTPLLARDQVDLELAGAGFDSSILSSVSASDESLILAAPEAADAVHAWNMVCRIAEMIGEVLTVDDLLRQVADMIFDHFSVDRLLVLTQDSDSGEMVPQVIRDRTSNGSNPGAMSASRTIVRRVLETREGVLCANAMTDERFPDKTKDGSIFRLELRSVICVPIGTHDEVLGVIHLDSSMSHHVYTHEQLRLITAIGRMTGMAIENIRLLRERMKTERLAAIGETAAYLSHHIRNILQGLRSGSDVLEQGLKRNNIASVAIAWPMIQRNLDRIFQLTTNMLTFSKDRRPNIEMAQLNTVIRDAVNLMQGPADAKSVMLLTDLPDDLPAVPIDVEGMHLVIVNLVSNAVAAVPQEHGRIVVGAAYHELDGEVVLSVEDNGPGIPPERRDAVFEAFNSTKGHGGTGLGLAAAKKVVAEMGGRIKIAGSPDRGTIFKVHLHTDMSPTEASDRTHGPGAVQG